MTTGGFLPSCKCSITELQTNIQIDFTLKTYGMPTKTKYKSQKEKLKRKCPIVLQCVHIDIQGMGVVVESPSFLKESWKPTM